MQRLRSRSPRLGLASIFAGILAWTLITTGGALSASAATITWTGVLRVILEDTGAGTYTGGTVDSSVFSGTVTYGDVCGGCLVEPFPPDEVNYVFPGGSGSLTGLGITTVGVESSVAITNDQIVTADGVALLAAVGIDVTVGSTIDVWNVASETDQDVIEWEVAFIYATTNPLSSTDYISTPPTNPDLIIFQVDDGDEVDYFAFGDVTIVPEPGTAALLGLGLAVAGWRRRRSRPEPRRR